MDSPANGLPECVGRASWHDESSASQRQQQRGHGAAIPVRSGKTHQHVRVVSGPGSPGGRLPELPLGGDRQQYVAGLSPARGFAWKKDLVVAVIIGDRGNGRAIRGQCQTAGRLGRSRSKRFSNSEEKCRAFHRPEPPLPQPGSCPHFSRQLIHQLACLLDLGPSTSSGGGFWFQCCR